MSHARRSGVGLAKLTLNILHHSLEYYALNRLQIASIHNDLGASFTTITRVGGRIRKTAQPDGEKKLRDEIEWILRFRDTSLRTHLPQILRYSLAPGNVYYEMKYYNYPNLRAVIMNEMNAPYFIKQRLGYLLSILKDQLWTEANSVPCPAGFFDTEYFEKFRARRVHAIGKVPFFRQYFDAPWIRVNNHAVLNAGVILDACREDPAIVRAVTPDRLYLSHGDLHCNNILCGFSRTNMILIDCRGKSSSGTMYFDPAYDVGKLFHDFNSLYSLIEAHHYSLFAVPGEAVPAIEVRILNPRAVKSFHYYRNFLRTSFSMDFGGYGNILSRAGFAEALLYLTMIPMHLRLKDEGLMCYVTGVLRLNEWLSVRFPELSASLRARHIPASELVRA